MASRWQVQASRLTCQLLAMDLPNSAQVRFNPIPSGCAGADSVPGASPGRGCMYLRVSARKGMEVSASPQTHSAGMEVSASPQTHQFELEVPPAHCVRCGMTVPRKGAEGEMMGGGDIRPVRGQSPEGRRHPATAMSRRDNSPVENGVGAGSPKPLQGLDGVWLRVSRASACICSQAFYGVLRGQRAICGGGRHNGY